LTLKQSQQALRASTATQGADARPPPLPVLVDYADLRALFGIKYSRVHIWRLARAGKFPPPVSLCDGGIRKAWRSQDVEAWVASLSYTNVVGNEPEAA